MLASAFSPRNLLSLAFLCLLTLALSGCGLFAQVMYTLKGAEEPARYAGLKGKRVAVVCFDANTLRGPGAEADEIAKIVSTNLEMKVKEIKMVRQAEVANWIDNQSHDIADFREVGRGVKADFVVGIDLKSFTIREGATLLKGRANCKVSVYDMTKVDQPVYSSDISLQYPETGARHVTENEQAFHQMFVNHLSSRISREFHAYDRMDEYGKDAKFIGD